MKKAITGLVASLLLASPFSAMGVCTSGVAPGGFSISLGKYSNWNSTINVTHCNTINSDCSITQSHTRVGNTTESANTRNELEALTNKFGVECLEKAAALNEKGQKGFVDVYADDLGYQGVMWQYFEGQANKCWDHYAAIFDDLEDDMCTVSLPSSE